MTSTDKIPVSVFIVAKNEEDYIENLLLSIEQFDEIILVDSGSTDNTIPIATKYCTRIEFNEWPGYAKQKQFAMSLCKHDWVLNLDADETLNPKIIEKIKQIIQRADVDSVRFLRNDIFIGERFSKWTKPANNLRLYRKSKAHFDDNTLVHETATIEGNEIQVSERFDHYGYDDVETLVSKCNQYSSLKAHEKYNKGKVSSLLKLILVFQLAFIKRYFLQGAIFSGRRGFIHAMINANYAFLKEAKLFEREYRNR